MVFVVYTKLFAVSSNEHLSVSHVSVAAVHDGRKDDVYIVILRCFLYSVVNVISSYIIIFTADIPRNSTGSVVDFGKNDKVRSFGKRNSYLLFDEVCGIFLLQLCTNSVTTL